MKRIVLLALLGIALPLAAQVNDTYVIPTVGTTNGANGTRWATQLSLFNPQTTYNLRVSLVFIPSGGAQSQEVLVTVRKNGSYSSDNIIGEVFKQSGVTGALLAATFPEDNPNVPDDVLSRSFLVVANTYNNASTGTFGQTIPGTWTGLQDIDTDGISSIAHGIRNGNAIAYRTNVGAVNLGRCSATVYVTVFDEDGNTVLDNAPFVVPPMGHLQQRLPVTIDRGTVEFYVQDPCANDANNYAVVFPYTSTIDNLSGDPSYQ
ncbi:MAG: hypothetical protein ACXVJO_14525, partial [Thermoanaerobaculia bacterium]